MKDETGFIAMNKKGVPFISGRPFVSFLSGVNSKRRQLKAKDLPGEWA